MKLKINHILIIILLCVLIFLFILTYKLVEGFDNKINYLDGIDVIYWINLDRSTDRRDKMELMLKDEVFNGIPTNRIIAVDGRMDDIKSVLYTNFTNATSETTNMLEYACLLSHLNSINTFLQSKYNIALIFEDDMSMEYKKYWKISISDVIANTPQDWEVIQLSYITPNDNVITETYTLNNKYISGCCAYLINKKGANKIINIQDNKYKLSDVTMHQADHYIYNTLITYIYKYPYFTYFLEKSTIHNDHLEKYHIPSKTIIDNMYLKLSSIKNVPLIIYQTWDTLNLPELMQKCVDKLKTDNPEFTHYLYDDQMRRQFIKDNFDTKVVDAYDTLVPSAFKADLWRYCILYKKGGVYLDIKFQCENNFKIIDVVNSGIMVKEYWRGDYLPNVVYNGFMIYEANNTILYKVINKICTHVKNKTYCEGISCQTGPSLLGSFYSKEQIDNIKYTYYENLDRGFIKNIDTDKIILSFYPEYRDEVKKLNKVYWQYTVHDKNVYGEKDNL